MTSTKTTAAKGPLLLKSDTRGRVQTPRAQREALLAEFGRSGMSGAAFARWAGVKYSTFAGWRHRQGKERSGGEVAVPDLKWVEAVAASGPLPAAGSALVIHLPGGVRVETGSGRLAAELLLGLRAC